MNSRPPRTMYACALAGALATAACGATRATTPATAPPPGPAQVGSSERGVIPVGQELDVRVQSSPGSETATVEQRFEATTVVDLLRDGRVLVPAGSIVRGVVSGVQRPGRIERAGSLTLSFDQMIVRGRELPMRAMATQVFQSGGIREEAGTIGAGAGIGGIVGGILGGVQGAPCSAR